MSSHRVAGAVAIVAFAALAQPARAGYEQDLARCANAVIDDRPQNITFFRHRFNCPGRIKVADENEIKKLPGFSGANAYFKGVLTRKSSSDTRITYFVVVESWAQNCKVPAPLMKIGQGNFFPATLRDYVFGGEWDDRGEVAKQLEAEWRDAAQLVVRASARKWAETYEFAKCHRDW